MNLKKLLTTTLLLTSSYLTISAQTVKTYAGQFYSGTGLYNGTRSSHKDSVYFSAPHGIDIDTAGRIYVSNEQNIMMLTGNTCKLMVGYNLDPAEPGAADSKDGTGIVARFSNPGGLGVYKSTNELFVADIDNHQIRKVSPYINSFNDLQVSTFAGVKTLNGGYLNSTNSASKFNAPVGIAVASNGDIYVADRNNHCIRKISNGNVTTIAGKNGVQGHDNGSGTNATFDVPVNVYIDGNTLYVADYGNSAIRKIDLSNNAVTDFITSGLSAPTDLCKFDGAWYITERSCVKKYENSILSVYVGSTMQTGNVDGAGNKARFEDITAIACNEKLNLLFIVDKGNNQIKSITPNGNPVCNFSTSNAAPTRGQTIILRNTSTNKPVNFKWTITPANYTLLNNTKLSDSIIYLSFNSVGSYTVKLWVNNSAGSDSLTKNNYIVVSSVTAAPVVDFSASNIYPAVNEVINLVDQSANEPTSWKWRISPATYVFVNGTDSTSRIPNIKFSNGDNYTITLIASNAQGSASLTKTDYVQVNGGSGVVSTRKAASLNIAPNPANTVFNVLGTQQGTIKIMNLQGQTVATCLKSDETLTIDIAELPSGLYIIVLETENGIYNNRLIKE